MSGDQQVTHTDARVTIRFVSLFSIHPPHFRPLRRLGMPDFAHRTFITHLFFRAPALRQAKPRLGPGVGSGARCSRGEAAITRGRTRGSRRRAERRKGKEREISVFTRGPTTLYTTAGTHMHGRCKSGSPQERAYRGRDIDLHDPPKREKRRKVSGQLCHEFFKTLKYITEGRDREPNAALTARSSRLVFDFCNFDLFVHPAHHRAFFMVEGRPLTAPSRVRTPKPTAKPPRSFDSPTKASHERGRAQLSDAAWMLGHGVPLALLPPKLTTPAGGTCDSSRARAWRYSEPSTALDEGFRRPRTLKPNQRWHLTAPPSSGPVLVNAWGGLSRANPAPSTPRSRIADRRVTGW